MDISSAEALAQSVGERRASVRFPDLNAELPLAARQELLVNRCLVRTAWPGRDDDFSPYDDTLTLPWLARRR